VFFVHNRVQNIKDVAAMIKRVCPDVSIAVAHGQMEGHELERVMRDFINYEFDVLVATTIIESGLDIPNANTIIINQAQNFGLSDLHQMRGRVGRSNKKAFCYLLSPPLSSLTKEARQRLKAIAQFSDLGSGFNIAMRDLDIRGAGNLLGGEQSGFISEIGFEMYQKILDEAISELKENEFKDLFEDKGDDAVQQFVKDTQIDTDLEFLIPDNYVNNVEERLILYQKLSELEREDELQAFHEELQDRFGPVPKETERLFELLRLRRVGKRIGFEKIVLKNLRLICYFIANQESPYYQSGRFQGVLEFIKNNPSRGQMKEKNSKLLMSFSGVSEINEAIQILRQMEMIKQEL